MVTGSLGVSNVLPSRPVFTYTNTFFNVPSALTTTSSPVSGESACISAHFGSASVLIFFAFGAVPSNVILPEIDAESAAYETMATINDAATVMNNFDNFIYVLL